MGSLRPQDKEEHRQIDTFRVFLSAGEEINDEHTSHDLDVSGVWDSQLVYQNPVLQSEFVYRSVWLLEQVLSTARQARLVYDHEWWRMRLNCALYNTPNQKPVAEILKHCSVPVVRSVIIDWICNLGASYNDDDGMTSFDFNRMYAKVGSLDFKAKPYTAGDEKEARSPLSAAMEKSPSVSKFRSILQELNIDIQAFVHEQAGLLDNGWTAETLLAMFNDTYHSIAHEDLYCVCCGCNDGDAAFYLNDIWNQRKQRIKAGKDPDGPFSEAEVSVQ